MKREEIDPNIAHIQVGEEFYQVLNEDGTDWDEEATRAQIEEAR